MATGMILLPPRPAITPPATPMAMPTRQVRRLPNLLASGTTKTAATAIGMAPSTASKDCDMPQASPRLAVLKKLLSSTHWQKNVMEPFFIAPPHWNAT